MSLDWDVSKIADDVAWETRTEYGKEGQYLTPLTESLIWASLMTGIGTITEKNAPEVFARLSFYERLNGSFLRKVEGETTVERPITVEDVQAHIGLKTNASFTDHTRAAWLKRIAATTLDDATRTYDRAIAAEKAVKAPVLTTA